MFNGNSENSNNINTKTLIINLLNRTYEKASLNHTNLIVNKGDNQKIEEAKKNMDEIGDIIQAYPRNQATQAQNQKILKILQDALNQTSQNTPEFNNIQKALSAHNININNQEIISLKENTLEKNNKNSEKNDSTFFQDEEDLVLIILEREKSIAKKDYENKNTDNSHLGDVSVALIEYEKNSSQLEFRSVAVRILKVLVSAWEKTNFEQNSDEKKAIAQFLESVQAATNKNNVKTTSKDTQDWEALINQINNAKPKQDKIPNTEKKNENSETLNTDKKTENIAVKLFKTAISAVTSLFKKETPPPIKEVIENVPPKVPQKAGKILGIEPDTKNTESKNSQQEQQQKEEIQERSTNLNLGILKENQIKTVKTSPDEKKPQPTILLEKNLEDSKQQPLKPMPPSTPKPPPPPNKPFKPGKKSSINE